MSRAGSLIVLEFNELTPAVMDEFIAQGHLPNFLRLKNQSRSFVTDAEEVPPNLEPWIQWVTVHTGQKFSEHGIFHLGDSARVAADAIWDVVSARGDRVWVCGSMNASQKPGLRGLLLPDPWSVHVRPSDDSLLPYFNFVRRHVMEYTRTSGVSTLGETWRFLSYMIRNGLRFSTVWAIARQLVQERFSKVGWRRATILDRLQFDLFKSHYKKLKPKLSTFFVNSTAHLQHVYWRNMNPDAFVLKPSAEEQRALKDAVLYGYKQMDRIVGEVLDMAGSDTAIAFVTALGQQPCLTYEASGGKCFYKVDEYRKLLEFAGIDPASCKPEPVMSEQFHVRFHDAAAARAGHDALSALRVNGQPVLGMNLSDSDVLAGCSLFSEQPPGTMISNEKGQQRPLSDLFYFVDTKKSGMHHPHGIFWLSVPGVAAKAQQELMPLSAVAQTLLDTLGVKAPVTMSTPAARATSNAA
jgi:hypothetical protein